MRGRVAVPNTTSVRSLVIALADPGQDCTTDDLTLVGGERVDRATIARAGHHVIEDRAAGR
ncbi:MAG TPA: hypothetical protein VFI54_13370 [Solirubrobacteraceae bacterium]|nr:hypothetical protein [Solirubrobacteraceae bacterium]